MERTECIPVRSVSSLRVRLSTAALTVSVADVPDVQVCISGDQAGSVSISQQEGVLCIRQGKAIRGVSEVSLTLPLSWKGALKAFTLLGPISISQFTGSDLWLHSVLGDVCAEGISCIRADVRTLRGTIALSGVSGDQCALHTTCGQVILSGCHFPQGTVSALRSRAELDFASGFDRLSLRCLFGSVTVYAPISGADAALTSVKGRLLTDGVSVQADAPRIRMLSVTADLQVIASLDDQAMI